MENTTLPQTWYIVKRSEGNCEIVLSEQVEGQTTSDIIEQWGPFASYQEAIARRIGLIRAGKCRPI